MFFYIFFVFLLLLTAYCGTKIYIADFRRRIIPDVYLFPLLLTGLVLTTFYQWPISISDAIIGGVFGYTISTVIGLIFDWRTQKNSKNIAPIGMGDIKLITTGGIWLGTSGLATTLIIACILGTIWGRRHHQRFIPFAPFFLIGAILTLIAMTILL